MNAEEHIQSLLRAPFHYCVIPDETGMYSGLVVEFPGCFADGNTAEECMTNLRSAAESWLIACTEEQRKLLVPADLHELRRNIQRIQKETIDKYIKEHGSDR